ncbi:MAG: hypothetical protein F9K29_18310 [Hyphomicrobiaceae bacterium]|nr:MAG: hypothetical protein F9K29_18310 [Hyphomicrobiaceae bacterium]
MSTVRETFGLACPKCGRDEELEVWAFTGVLLTPDGTVEAKDSVHEWSESHHCECRACGFQAQVDAFTVDETRKAEVRS